MNINLTEIIVAFIGLLGVIITAVVVPFIKKKTTITQQKDIAMWVKIAVSAAEQIFNGTKAGAEKKAYVIKYLQEMGIDLEDERIKKEVNLLIEAFVSEMNGKVARVIE